MICWKCKKNFEMDKVFRSSECPFCHVDLHACKGCKFYAPGNHFDCKETVDNPVADKEKSNFCDFFAPSEKIEVAGDSKKTAALDSFNALFGDSSTEKDNKSSKDAFNALFGGGICL